MTTKHSVPEEGRRWWTKCRSKSNIASCVIMKFVSKDVISVLVVTDDCTWTLVKTQGAKGELGVGIGHLAVEGGLVDLLGRTEGHAAAVVVEVLARL